MSVFRIFRSIPGPLYGVSLEQTLKRQTTAGLLYDDDRKVSFCTAGKCVGVIVVSCYVICTCHLSVALSAADGFYKKADGWTIKKAFRFSLYSLERSG